MKKRILIPFFTLLVLGSIFLHEPLLKKMGQFLIYEEPPQKADLILVLNGADVERSLAVADTYKSGYASMVVLTNQFKDASFYKFMERVGGSFDRKVFLQRAIEALGVDECDIKLIGNGTRSTYDEAKVVKNFLKKQKYTSILLITSRWHSKRAYLTFKSVLKNDGIKIINYPSKYDTFNPNEWWTTRKDAKIVLYEYERLVYYLFKYGIGLGTP